MTTKNGSKIHRSRKFRQLSLPVEGMLYCKVGTGCEFYRDDGQLHTPVSWYGMSTSPVFYINLDGEFMVYVPTLGLTTDQARGVAREVLYDLRVATTKFLHTHYHRYNLPPCTVIESRVPTEYAEAFHGMEEAAALFASYKHPNSSIREALRYEGAAYIQLIKKHKGSIIA